MANFLTSGVINLLVWSDIVCMVFFTNTLFIRKEEYHFLENKERQIYAFQHI